MRQGTRLVPDARLFVALCLLLLGLAPPSGVYARSLAQGAPQERELTALAEDVYVFRAGTYQALFIVTDAGVIATDPIGLRDPTAPEAYRAAIASVTPQPVRYVVYGHDHQDHIAGGRIFADTAQFVSQRLAAPRIAARADADTPEPTIVFDRFLQLELGGKVVELHYLGPAHSDNDLVLIYPARRIAFVTDVIEPQALPPMRFSVPAEYLTAMRWVEANLDFDVRVAGHPPVGSMDSVRELRQYLEDLNAAVAAARARGLADGSDELADAVRAALAPRYGGWDGFQARMAGNIAAVLEHEPAR